MRPKAAVAGKDRNSLDIHSNLWNYSPMATDGPYRDKPAGRLIRQLRIDAGKSPEELSWALYSEQGLRVSGRAIRYIEREGVVPLPRTQFALASYFGRAPSQVWAIKDRVAA